jgi:hypothetical protein
MTMTVSVQSNKTLLVVSLKEINSLLPPVHKSRDFWFPQRIWLKLHMHFCPPKTSYTSRQSGDRADCIVINISICIRELLVRISSAGVYILIGTNSMRVPRLDCSRFLPNTFQFIVYHVYYNLMLFWSTSSCNKPQTQSHPCRFNNLLYIFWIILSCVRGSATNNNAFWIGWLDSVWLTWFWYTNRSLLQLPLSAG